MWKRFRRRRTASRLDGGAPSAEQAVLLRALQDLAGTARGVVYDVPRETRPWARDGSPVFVDGSPAWQRYLRARRSVDDGQLTMLLSHRQLGDYERRLAVDWGTSYANSFLLVEPRDERCDLSDPHSAIAIELLELSRPLTKSAVEEDSSPRNRWTAQTPLGERLRELYGRWVYWDAPPPAGHTTEVPLVLSGANDTLSTQLLAELYVRFPQESFDAALVELRLRELELFGGPVARARTAFKTRLGLPILHDPRAVDRAVRQLVNMGKMSVVSGFPRHRTFGPGHQVPDDLPEDEFERLFMN